MRIKPLLELHNFVRTTQVTVCGIDISKALRKVAYKTEKDKRTALNRVILRLDIDLRELVSIIEELKKEDAEKAIEILASYLHHTELVEHWRSQSEGTPES